MMVGNCIGLPGTAVDFAFATDLGQNGRILEI
jgi:hypothetical protein